MKDLSALTWSKTFCKKSSVPLWDSVSVSHSSVGGVYSSVSGLSLKGVYFFCSVRALGCLHFVSDLNLGLFSPFVLRLSLGAVYTLSFVSV